MERDQQPYQTELTSIHINLAEQAIEFEDRHGTVGRLRFTGETVLYEGQPLLLTPTLALAPEAPATSTTPPHTEQPRHRLQPGVRSAHNSS